MAVDLHTHSCRSDGTLTPSELVSLAKNTGLSAVALTDHDTASGNDEAAKTAQKLGITFIPGIEISSLYSAETLKDKKDIHILGLGIDSSSTFLAEKLEYFRKIRASRNERMFELIRKNLCDIDEAQLKERYPGAVLTRAHFAEFLAEKKAVSSVKEAFDKYLGDGKPCFIPKEGITCREAVECILKAGGHPVLAHPTLYRLTGEQLDRLIEELIDCGLQGIESVYSTYTQSQEREMRRLAARYGLHITGGSDFHGSKKPEISIGTGLGNLYVPDDTAKWIL